MSEIENTVFESFCVSYEDAQKVVGSYLEAYGQLMGNLVKGFSAYIQCPEGRIKFLDREGNNNSLREAMYLENGAWKLRIEICMWRENGAEIFAVSHSGIYYPSQKVFMILSIRGTAESFFAKLDQYDDEFSISKESERQDEQNFYGFIAEKIKSHYKNMLHYIIEHGKVPVILNQV
jgi:hypothetical protein